MARPTLSAGLGSPIPRRRRTWRKTEKRCAGGSALTRFENNEVDVAPISTLRELLGRSAWQEGIRDLPGYDTAGAGQVISLSRALPWYAFRTPK